MLASQSGPHASRVFTTIPHSEDFVFPSHLFRLLLLRRLRRPLPLTERSCRCRRVLDPFGDHRAACPRSGVLRGRGCPLERAAARICREAGARVTTNTLLTHLNLPSLHRLDQRRIEVIANGLPLHQGAQLAVDTTLVSPFTTSSQPRRRQGNFAGAALTDARRSKERTYPELLPGPWNRSRGPIPLTSGSRQNTLRSFSAPPISNNGFRLSMVGPARCSCLPLLRSQSALGRNRHALQPGCRSTTPQRCPVANPSSPSGLPPCALRAPVAWTSARVCFCCCAPPSSIR